MSLLKSCLLFLVLIVLISAQNCTKTKSCLKLGATGCKVMPTCSYDVKNTTCCALGLACVGGTCKTDNYGDKCSADKDCLGPAPGGNKCIKEKCAGVFNLGDKCSDNAGCIGLANCTNGVCTGLGSGKKCKPTECGFNLFCDSTNLTCKAKAKTGEDCKATVPCEFGNVCLDSKCVAVLSRASGEACVQTLCQPGLYCKDKKCAEADTKPIYKTCTKNDDCTSKKGWICGPCSEFSGQRYCAPGANATQVYLCQKEAKNTYDCLIKQKCLTSAYLEGSCGYDKCKAKLSSEFGCQCQALRKLGEECVYFPTCSTGLPIWVWIVIGVGAVVAVILLVAVLSKACRGDSYQSLD